MDTVTPQAGPQLLEDPLDLDALASLRQLDETGALFTEIVGLFLSDASARLGVLRDAVARQSSAEVASAAHGLKGGALGIGANNVAILCRHLEDLGRRGVAEGVEAGLSRLEEELARVAELLRGQLAN